MTAAVFMVGYRLEAAMNTVHCNQAAFFWGLIGLARYKQIMGRCSHNNQMQGAFMNNVEGAAQTSLAAQVCKLCWEDDEVDRYRCGGRRKMLL